MNISKMTMDQYRAVQQEQSQQLNRTIDLHADVLTAGYWPTQSQSPCKLPPQIKPFIDLFEGFYLSKHTGRKLTWQVMISPWMLEPAARLVPTAHTHMLSSLPASASDEYGHRRFEGSIRAESP